MKAVIIDDKSSLRNALKLLVENHLPQVTIVGEAESVAKGNILIENVSPDLIFLDVELGDGTGFDILLKFPDAHFKVIFITAHDHYAIRAIKYSALDYLLKPVDVVELKEAVTKAENTLTRQAEKLRGKALEAMLHNMNAENSLKKIVLTDSENIHLLDKKDIIRCQAEGNYTHFFLTNNRKILVSQTLKEYVELLNDKNFFRVHHAHLLNLDYFSHFEKAHGGIVHMTDGSTLPVAVRRKDNLLKALKNQ